MANLFKFRSIDAPLMCDKSNVLSSIYNLQHSRTRNNFFSQLRLKNILKINRPDF